MANEPISALSLAFQEIIDNGLLEKYKSMSHAQLQVAEPQLNEREIRDLWLAIQSMTNPEYQVDKVDPIKFHGICVEALEDMDAWTPSQQMTIRAFLADIAMGVGYAE